MVATGMATATATATVMETASSGSSGGRLAAGCRSSSKQNAIADTCFLCCFLVRKLNVCYTWHRMPPEFRPEFLSLEFLSPEFRTKLILPWNDLIPMCVPRNSGNSADYPEFRKMRTRINRNTGQNAQPSPNPHPLFPSHAPQDAYLNTSRARRHSPPSSLTSVTMPRIRRLPPTWHHSSPPQIVLHTLCAPPECVVCGAIPGPPSRYVPSSVALTEWWIVALTSV